MGCSATSGRIFVAAKPLWFCHFVHGLSSFSLFHGHGHLDPDVSDTKRHIIVDDVSHEYPTSHPRVQTQLHAGGHQTAGNLPKELRSAVPIGAGQGADWLKVLRDLL